MGRTKALRTEIELVQTYEKHQGFTHTTTSDDSEVVLVVTMEEGNKITLKIDSFDAFVEFDGEAQSDGTSMIVPVNTGYDDDNIFIVDKICIKNAVPGNNARIRGILWGS